MIAYFNGEYLEHEKICISPNDRGFLFSYGLYEVVRLYHGHPFRMEDHQRRMEMGTKFLRFERGEFPEFPQVVWELQNRDELQNLESSTVYFQVTRGVALSSHTFPPKGTPLTTYAFIREFTSHIDEQKYGAKAIRVADERWMNSYIKTISLLPNTLAHQSARDNHAIEAIFIRDQMVQVGCDLR